MPPRTLDPAWAGAARLHAALRRSRLVLRSRRSLRQWSHRRGPPEAARPPGRQPVHAARRAIRDDPPYLRGLVEWGSGRAEERGALKLYDSRRRRVEPFDAPAGRVRMYVCGITPYDTTHLGHVFTYLLFDVLGRSFRRNGFE